MTQPATRSLLLLTLLMAVTAPLAMYSGRIPGYGEFDYLIFYRLMFYNDFNNSLAMLAGVLLMLVVRPLRDWVEKLAELVSLNPKKTCVIAFIVFAITARYVYQGFPLAMDEYAPLLQARIFASGHLAATYPRELLNLMVPPGFQGMFILVNHETGQVASAYWPGLALLMTPFALFGGEWLLNPLLGAIGLWLIGDLAKQASGQESARGWAILAALACPQYTVNALSFYAMPGLLTLDLLYLWLLLRTGWRSALLAGVIGSVALVLHNPVPHALIAAPVGIWLLTSPDRRRRIVPLVAGYLPLTALLCLGWPMLTSSMGLHPTGVGQPDVGFINSWMHKLGQIFVLPGIDLLRVRSYAAWKTLIWAAPGLVLVTLLAKKKTSVQRLLLASLLLSFAFYFFFPYDQGHGWGYRYIHQAWGVIAISAGIFATTSDTSRRNFIAMAVGAGLLATPIFLHTTHGTIATSIALQPPVPPQGKALVFISRSPTLYTVDLVRNYPQEQGRIIRMTSASTEFDRKMAERIMPGVELFHTDERGSTWQLPAPTSDEPL